MKNLTFLFLSLISMVSFAQTNDFSPSYIDNSLMRGDQLGGTARYQSLSGAMSSLGGDLSAIGDNPAGVAVFNNFEGAVSFGLNSVNNTVPSISGRNSSKESTNQFVFNQLGGVFVFNSAESDWKSFSFGINSQNIGAIKQSIGVNRDEQASLFQTAPDTRVFNGYLSSTTGSNYRTNFAFGANYQNNFYLGGSLDVYNFTRQTSNEFYEEVSNTTGIYDNTYIASDNPMLETSTGVGLSFGVIYKPIQEVRLGLSYKSPIWQTVNRETPNYELFNFTKGMDTFNYYEQNGQNLSSYDLANPSQVTLGGSYVFKKLGFISVDYSFKDYRGTNFSPSNSFRQENLFVDNVLQSTTALKIGVEFRANKVFTLRGGFRSEQSPFNYNKLENYYSSTGARANYYGDLTGYSMGFGIKLNNGWYIDTAYNTFSRNRELFIYGNHLDLINEDTNPDFLETDFSPSGEGNVIIENIKEINHNFSLTLGFRF